MKRILAIALGVVFLLGFIGMAMAQRNSHTDNVTAEQLTNGTVDYMRLDPNPTEPTCQEAIFYWDATDHTFAICPDVAGSIMQIGQEMWVRVVNKTGEQIANGTVVIIQGAQGQRPKIVKADASTAALSHGTIGLATEDIADNAEGFVTHIGLVRGVKTDDFAPGDVLYLDTTAGEIVNSPPSAPNHAVRVGQALNSHANQGAIFTNVDVGGEMADLHDVDRLVVNAVASDSLLFDGNVWVNVPHTFGELFYHGEAGATLDFSTNEALINVTGLADGLANNMTLNDTNGSIAVIDADVHRASLSASFQAASAGTFDLHIGIDGVDQDKCHANRRIGTGTDVGNTNITCLLDLAAGEVVTFMVNSAASETIKFEALNFNLERIP